MAMSGLEAGRAAAKKGVGGLSEVFRGKMGE